MEFSLNHLWYLGSIPLILGLVEVIKPFVSDTRWYLPAAVAVGIILNMVIGWQIGNSLVASAIVGTIAGLSAGGVYSGGATLREGPLADKANRPASDITP